MANGDKINPLTGLPMGSRAQSKGTPTKINPISGLPQQDFSTDRFRNELLRNFNDRQVIYEGDDNNFKKYAVQMNRFNDIFEQRAQNQPLGEKWKNGVLKFVGKTGTAVAGATVGTLVGFKELLENGSLTNFYDNDMQTSLDRANEWMDGKLPNYKTKWEQEANFWQSLTRANFWADDVLGALSFTSGAVLSELMLSGLSAATLGAGSPLQSAAIAKQFATAKTLLKGWSKLNKQQQAWSAGAAVRRLITGAGYESAVEARHYRQTAMDQFMQANPNASEEELADAAKFINAQSNWIFAGNLALVGYSNAVQFKKIFGSGIKSNASAGFTKGVTREGDALTGTFKAAVENARQWQKNVDIGWRTIKNPLMEGFVEEGGQAMMTNTATNFLTKGYSPDGLKANYDIIDAVSEAFAETYTSAEGFKEIGIGMLIGAMGSPTFRKAPWEKGGWSGGIMEGIEEYRAGKEEQETIASINNRHTYDNMKEQIIANTTMMESQAEIDAALESGDIFSAKNAETDKVYAMMLARSEAGMLGDLVDSFTDRINNLSTEEFKAEFGYTDLTDQEAIKRKADAIKSFKEKSEMARKAIAQSKSLVSNTDYTDTERRLRQKGVGHAIYSTMDLDRRESQMIEELRELLPGIDPNLVKKYVQEKFKNDRMKALGAIGGTTTAKNRANQEVEEAKMALKAAQDAAANLSPEAKSAKLADIAAKINKLAGKASKAKTSERQEILDDLFAERNKAAKELKKLIEKAEVKGVNVEKAREAYKEVLDKIELRRRELEAMSDKQHTKALEDDLTSVLGEDAEMLDLLEMYEKEAQKIKDMPEGFNKDQAVRIVGDLNKMQALRLANIRAYNTFLLNKSSTEVKDILKMEEEMIMLFENMVRRRDVGKVLEGTPTKEKVETQETDLVKRLRAEIDADLAKANTPKGYKAIANEWIQKLEQEKLKTSGKNNIDGINSLIEDLKKKAADAENALKEQKDKEEEAKANLFEAIISQPKHLTTVLYDQLDADTRAEVNAMTNQEFKDALEFRVDDYEGNNYGRIHRQDKWHDKAHVKDGHSRLKGKAVHAYINGKKIGYLPDPRRFVDSMGVELDLSKPENLGIINPDFVDNGDITVLGSQFLARWLTTKEAFEKYLDKADGKVMAKKAFTVYKDHSLKVLRDVPFKDRPKLGEFLGNKHHSVEIPGVGKGLVVAERRPDGSPGVYNHIWYQEEGTDTWELLDRDREIAAKKFVEGLKGKKGESKFDIEHGGQYAVVAANNQQGEKRQAFVYDLGKPSFDEVERETLEKHIQDKIKAKMAEEGTDPKGVILDDPNGNPLFVALKADKFLDKDTQPVRVQLYLSKYPPDKGNNAKSKSGVKLRIVFKHEGNFYEAKVIANDKSLKEFSLDNLEKTLAGMISKPGKRAPRIAELKKTFPTLEFSRIQKIVDKQPADLNQLTMNAIPRFEIFVHGNNYKEVLDKIDSVPNPSKSKKKSKKTTTTTTKKPRKGTEGKNPDGDNFGDSTIGGGLSVPEILTLSAYVKHFLGLNSLEEFEKDLADPDADALFSKANEARHPGNVPNRELTKLEAHYAKLKDEAGVSNENPVLEEDPVPTKQPESPQDLGEFGSSQEDVNKVNEEANEFDSLFDDLPPADRRTSTLEEEALSYEQQLERVRGLLPEWYPIEVLEENMSNIVGNNILLGTVKEMLMYLSENAGKTTVDHEVFHAIFRTFMTAEEIMDILEAAKKKYKAPTKQDLMELRSLSLQHMMLSKEDLTTLYYEEKLADGFADYRNNKPSGFIEFFKELWRRIQAWLGLGDSIENLYKNIDGGKYLTAKPQVGAINKIYSRGNITPANLTIKAVNMQGNQEANRVFSSLDSTTTSNIVHNVINNLMERGETSKLAIMEEIQHLANTYYNKNVWMEEVKQLGLKNRDAAKAKWNKLIVINNALNNQDNIDAITRHINERLKAYDVLAAVAEYEHDLQEQDYESNSESDFGRFNKASYEIGGIGSVSKRMKEYIYTTTDMIDEFGFNVSEDYMAKHPEKFNRPVSGDNIYYGILRTMVNTDIENMFNKFHQFQKHNKASRAFYNKFTKDVAGDIGITKDRVIEMFEKESLDETDMNKLAKSARFNDFITAFNKDQVDFYTALFDKQSGKSRVFSSNRVGSDQIQVDSWRSNFEALGLDKATVRDIIRQISERYNTRATINEEHPGNSAKYMSLERHVKDIANLFEKIGIKLSVAYIKWSLLDFHREDWEQLASSRTYQDKYLRFKSFYSTFKAVPLHITEDKTTNFFAVMDKANTVSTLSDTNPTGFFKTEVNEQGREVGDSGILGSARKVAKGNSIFDETVGDSTFRNAENKQVYNKLFPSFITTLVRRIHSLEDISKLKDIYKKSSEYEQGIIEQVLSKNNILNGLRISETVSGDSITYDENWAKFVLNNLEAIIADGIREESISDDNVIESWKDSEEGKTYKNLSAEGQELYKLILYHDSGLQNREVLYTDEDNNKHSVEMRYFLANNSEKSTQIFVKLPVVKNIIKNVEQAEDGTVTFELPMYAKESLYNLMYQEYDRIQKVLGEVYDIQNGNKTTFISKAYHGSNLPRVELKNGVYTMEFNNLSELPRGLKFFRWQGHPMAEELTRAALEGKNINSFRGQILDSFTPLYQNMFNQYLDKLANAAMIEKVVEKDKPTMFKNLLLPKETYESEDLNMHGLLGYFMNHTINTANFSQLAHGDLALSYKNLDDYTKRNGGLIAAGPSFRGKVRFKTKSTIEEGIEELDSTRHGITGTMDRTDAQNFGSMRLYMDQYLTSFGKSFTRTREILKKVARGLDVIESLTITELNDLDNFNANLHDRKIVGRDLTWYDKTSLHTLTRAETSRLAPDFRGKTKAQLRKLINERYEAWEKNPTAKNAEKVNEMWEAIPGREYRHELVNEMFRDNYDLAIYDSASKMARFDVDFNVVHEVDGEYLREQVVTDGFKNKIVHGTQLLQLIWSEQGNPDAIVKWNGKSTTIGNLVQAYKSLMAKRIEARGLKYMAKEAASQHALFQYLDNGQLTPQAYANVFRSITQTGLANTADPWVAELFQQDGVTGDAKYDPNYPAIRLKFEAMYLAYMSNKLFKSKVAGRKYTLVSDIGMEMPREIIKANVDKEVALANPEIHIEKDGIFYEIGNICMDCENTINTRLRHRIKDYNRHGDEIYVSEAVVSEKAARQMGYKPGDVVTMPQEKAIQFGVRIPTQDKHSMVNIKIVATIPYYYGNSIMLPKEIVLLSGADFDIDSLFAQMYEMDKATIIKNKKKETVEVTYGSYYNAKNPTAEAFTEWKTYNKVDIPLSEFKNIETPFGKMSDVIDRNVKAFRSGDLQLINPITEGETNNLMLDLQLNLSAHRKDIAATPATMDALKDTLKDMTENYGIQSTGTTGIDTPLDNMKTAKALEIGSRGIGVSAVYNTLFQRLVQLEGMTGISMFEKGSFEGFETILDGELVRKNDVFSAIISAMTDNAKERLATEFNLTLDTLGAAMHMMAVGVPADQVLWIMRQPVVSKFTQHMNRENSPIKLDDSDENQVEPYANLDAATTRALNYTERDLALAELEEGQEIPEYNKRSLAEAINEYEADGTLSEKSRKIQEYIFREFRKAKVAAEELRAFRAVTVLLKGMDTSWYKVERVKESLAKLGVEVKGRGTDPSNYFLEQRLEEKTQEPDNYLRINYAELIKKSLPVDAINLKTLYAQMEGAKHHFILQSRFSKFIKEYIQYNMTEGYWKKYENHKKFEDSLISYFASVAFKKAWPHFGFTLEDLFKEDTYNNINILKQKFPDNEFLKAIKLTPHTYTNKKSPYVGKTIYKISIETNRSPDPNVQEGLIRGFTNLYGEAANMRAKRREDGDVKNEPQTMSTEEKTIYDLIGYLVVKDGMLFKNGSYIRTITPFILQDAFTSLKRIKKGLAINSLDFEAMFGVKRDKLMRDFEEKFLRWNKASYGLKSFPDSNLYVGGKTKAAWFKWNNPTKITINTRAVNKSEVIKKTTVPAMVKWGIYGMSGKTAFPRFIKANKKIFRLQNLSYYSKRSNKMYHFTRSGMLIGDEYKNKHINYLIKAENAFKDKDETAKILRWALGDSARYEVVSNIGNNDVSPFASSIREHEKIAKAPVKKQTVKPTEISSYAQSLVGNKPAPKTKVSTKPKETTNEWSNFTNKLMSLRHGDIISMDKMDGDGRMEIKLDVARMTPEILNSLLFVRLNKLYIDGVEIPKEDPIFTEQMEYVTILFGLIQEANYEGGLDAFLKDSGIEFKGQKNKFIEDNSDCKNE
jgi:hypothetical protein